METKNIRWNERIPVAIKEWVVGAANTADTPGDEAAVLFGEWYSEDGTMVASGGPAHGRQAISEAHRKAWIGVKSKQHLIDKVYTLDDHATEVMVLGKLHYILDDGNVLEPSFAVQVIFEAPIRDSVKAKHWQIWTEPQNFS